MTNDQITVSRALLQQAIDALSDTQTDGESPQWDIEKAAYDALREALAHQADELKQLQDQNTALDAKLASHEAVMRQALEALEVHCSFAKRDGPCAMEDGITAINAIQDILK